MLGTAYFPKQYKIFHPHQLLSTKAAGNTITKMRLIIWDGKAGQIYQINTISTYFQHRSPTPVHCFCKEKNDYVSWMLFSKETTLLFEVVFHQINSIFIVSDFLVASSDLIKAIMPFQLTTITLIRWITTRKKRKQLPKLIKLVHPYLQTAIKSVDFSPVSNFSTHRPQGMVAVHSQLNSEREVLRV